MRRPCPICQDLAQARLFAEANLDPARLDEYAFASRKIPEYMHHELWICDGCQLVFADRAPDDSALEAAYQGAAFDSRGDAARTYIRALRPMIAHLPARGCGLDIGAGDGAFLQELLQVGFEVVRGIEPSSAPLAVAAPSVRALILPRVFEPNLFSAESFDLVTCFQTIEHVRDPLGLCREALRLLRPGGMFCMVGHNRQALSARVLGRRSPIYDIEHLQLFTPESVRKLLLTAGFASVQVRSLWNRYSLSYWTKLFPFPPRVKHIVLAWLARSRAGSIRMSLPAGNLIAVTTKAKVDNREVIVTVEPTTQARDIPLLH